MVRQGSSDRLARAKLEGKELRISSPDTLSHIHVDIKADSSESLRSDVPPRRTARAARIVQSAMGRQGSSDSIALAKSEGQEARMSSSDTGSHADVKADRSAPLRSDVPSPAVRMFESSTGRQGSSDRITLVIPEGQEASTRVERKPDKTAPLLSDVPSHRRVSVLWKGINAYVPIFNARKTWKQRVRLEADNTGEHKQVQVLYNVRGVVQPTELLGLMGPSGSGKTSLISILGGRKPKSMTVSGDVSFNGVQLSRMLQSSMGFVLQDDILFDSLTVDETLYFAARLRLPHDMPLKTKRERVDGVITALGLEKCRNTLVGGPMRRGVSGGERKRVSVGHELLISPSIIILDEPTSGLDSTTAMSLVQTLRDLAKDGRTIITTIHQPSSRLFQKLDRLMLMSSGKVMYSGLGREVGEWFAHFKCKLPYGWNIADYILDLANGEFQDDTDVLGATGRERKTKLIEKCDAFLKECEDGYHGSKDFHILNGLGQGQPVGGSSDRSSKSSVSRRLRQYLPSKKRMPPPIEKLGARFMEQLLVLIMRCWKTRRLEAMGVMRLLNFSITGIIVGMLWWQVGRSDTLTRAADTSAMLFFMILFLLPAMMFGALFTFPKEMKMLVKERSSGMYHIGAYFFSRTISHLPLDLLYPSSFVYLVYFMGGLRLTFQHFLAHWMGVMLAMVTAQSIGLLLGASVQQFEKAQVLATVVILTLMLVGGFFARHIPAALFWLKWISCQYWAYSLMAKIEFRGRNLIDCGLMDSITENDIQDESECAKVEDVAAALHLPRKLDEPVMVEVAVLFLQIFVVRYWTYLVLRRRTRA